MKFARTILAPIILLALLLTQVAPAANASFATPRASCCCHQATCCCQSQPSSKSEPVPATAARAITQSDWQIVTPESERIVSSDFSPRHIHEHALLPVAAALIPLYQRNCAL